MAATTRTRVTKKNKGPENRLRNRGIYGRMKQKTQKTKTGLEKIHEVNDEESRKSQPAVRQSV